MLSNRRLTLFQRCTYANSCMLSKIWYVTHIYPLTKKYAKEINKIIFLYIWNGRYEPVRRTTVYRSRKEGGLGIINWLLKSQVILLNSFIRSIINEDYHNPFMYFYCYIRMHNILDMEYSIHDASLTMTPYYEIIYGLIQNVLHIPSFPVVSNTNLYKFILPRENSYAETHYPTFNWKQSWKNFCSTIFNPFEKEIIYKHLHICLATNQRLSIMNLSTARSCTNCSENVDHTALHMFYECENVKPLFQWLLRIFYNICNFRPRSNIKCIYFDTIYTSSNQKNMCNMFLYIYIVILWKTRKENLRIGILKNLIIKNMSDHLNFIKHMPDHRLEKLFDEISRLDINNLINL